MIGSSRRCLQLPDAELMMQPKNMYLFVHDHHCRVALACDDMHCRFATWRDHELILSRAVGMTFSLVWGGIWRGEGASGKNSGSRLTPGPLQHGVCSTGCRMSDILAQSDHAAKAEVDHHLRSVSERSAMPRIVQHPDHPHWRGIARLGR